MQKMLNDVLFMNISKSEYQRKSRKWFPSRKRKKKLNWKLLIKVINLKLIHITIKVLGRTPRVEIN